MNNEPVAWAYILDGGDFMDAIHPEEHNRHEGKYTTPLYTYPAKTLKQIKGINYWVDAEPKTLTDEEILNCMGCLPKYNSEIVDDDLVEFARTILRKAQEK